MADLPLTMKLPYPVSANRYWRKLPLRGQKGAREIMVVSDEGKAYKDDIGWRVKSYGVTAPVSGRVKLDVQLFPKRPLDWAKRAGDNPLFWDDEVARIDADNVPKVLFDALKGVLFNDDFWVFKFGVEIMEPIGEAHVLVHFDRYVRMRDPQGSLL